MLYDGDNVLHIILFPLPIMIGLGSLYIVLHFYVM